jgi:ubiquinone/menaquinone biosynthesis C-methylase UbiE
MLDSIGVQAGWRCLDVGAGSGSITKLLAQRVGRTGSVLAIDLETSLLEPLMDECVEVRCQNLLVDPLPEAAFDLVHARHVLMHVPSRRDALERMVGALRPGGYLAIGDATMADVAVFPRSAQWERAWSAFLDALVATGWDARYGQRLIDDLEALELVDVCAEEIRAYARGGSVSARLLSGTIERLRERMDASDEDIDAAVQLLDDPTTSFWRPTIVAAWARRP